MRRMIVHLGRVFLSEEGQVRFHDIEKLRDHGGHAAKMSRTRAAAELVAETFDRDIGDGAGGIHLFHAGSEKKIYSLFFEQGAIALKVARIFCQILTGAELKRIYKNEAATRSHCALAARTSERWPSCSAPIVGTRPRRLPALRWLRLAARISSIAMCRFS